MLKLALRRICGLVPTLFVIVSVSFAIIRLAPGGPFDQEQTLTPAVRANLEVSLRLARLVDEFALPDETEPASVFTA